MRDYAEKNEARRAKRYEVRSVGRARWLAGRTARRSLLNGMGAFGHASAETRSDCERGTRRDTWTPENKR